MYVRGKDRPSHLHKRDETDDGVRNKHVDDVPALVSNKERTIISALYYFTDTIYR